MYGLVIVRLMFLLYLLNALSVSLRQSLGLMLESNSDVTVT